MTVTANGLQNALVYSWEYADAAARTAATGFVAADVGKLARQLDSNTLWMLTATTPTWVQQGSGGAGLLAVNNLSDVASAGTSRTNLGLGTAATKNVPASGNAASGEAVLGSDTRLADARTPTAHASSHQSGGSDAFTGVVPGSAFAPAGLTGATAASRYAGATTSGAPASGTFAVGDWVVDQTGKRWTCTVAGTPGTWAQEPGAGGGGGGSGFYTAYVCIRDEKASGTHGGTFTSGAKRTRDLNTEVADTGNNASVASNQITLAAGTYDVWGAVPGTYCGAHRAYLQNITAGTTLLEGTSAKSSASETDVSTTNSILEGPITLAVSSVLEVQQRCATTRATDGFGAAGVFGTNEIYTVITFKKRA